MMPEIYEAARARLAQRLSALTDEEVERLTKASIGERLQFVLDYLNSLVPGGIYTAYQVAERTGKSSTTLYQLLKNEYRNPGAEFLDALNRELGLPTWFLLGRFDERKETGPASILARLPAHLREYIVTGKNLEMVTEFLELAKLASDKGLSHELIKEVRSLIEDHPAIK